MTEQDSYILEFVIKSLECKNPGARKSPILLNMAGIKDSIINPKSSTVCKIIYGKGKRLKFAHSTFMDLKASFLLLYGHGDQTVRAMCSIDFLDIAQEYESYPPKIYKLDVGMHTCEGNFFGTLSIFFQLFSAKELSTSETLMQTSKKKPTSRISVHPQTPHSSKTLASNTTTSFSHSEAISPIRTKALTIGNESSRSTNSTTSIHDRYMNANNQWLGNHCSTKLNNIRTGRLSARSDYSSARSFHPE